MTAAIRHNITATTSREAAKAFARAIALLPLPQQTGCDVTTLYSTHGYFMVLNLRDSHIVLFFNELAKSIHILCGLQAKDFLSVYAEETDRENLFPIRNTTITPPLIENRSVIALSAGFLRDQSLAPRMEYISYRKHIPRRQDSLVVCGEERPIRLSRGSIINWRDAATLKYDRSRFIRKRGLPSQIVLHETDNLEGMTISGATAVNKEKARFNVPHFCINQRGQNDTCPVLQFVDTVEHTWHANDLNDRAIGIEVANQPVPNQNNSLQKEPRGALIRTNLTAMPAVFVPLDIIGSTASDSITLRIPKSNLLNTPGRNSVYRRQGAEGTLTENDGVVSIRGVNVRRLECTVELCIALQQMCATRDIDLHNEEHHFGLVKVRGKKIFLFESACISEFKSENGTKVRVASHYGIDIRMPGIVSHAVSTYKGDRSDGGVVALYLYLRLVEKLDPENAIQRVVDLLVSSGESSAARVAVVLEEKVTVQAGGREIVPTQPGQIRVTNYVTL